MPWKRAAEWEMAEWIRAGVELYRRPGDFSELSGLTVHPSGRELMRSPGWSAQVNTPANFVPLAKGGAFFDAANTRYVLVGTDSTNIVSCYASSAWSMAGNYTLVSSMTDLGGLGHRNVIYSGGDVYLIGSDSDVYRGSDYAASLGAALYTGSDAVCLASAGERIYMAASGGTIYRLNDADDAFESLLAPVVALDVHYMAAFRGYLLVVAEGQDGTLVLYRLSLPSATYLHELGRVDAMGGFPANGCLYAIHDDKLYFGSGIYTLPGSISAVDVWEFNGSRLERVCQVSEAGIADNMVGLTSWRGELLLYEIVSGSAGSLGFKALVGDAFVEAYPLGGSLAYYHADTVGPELAALCISGPGGDYGVRHAGAASYQDGYVVSSRFDAGRPGKEKRLEEITVILDGAVSDFKIPVRYRVNDNTSWTLATTGNNTRWVNVVDLGVSFRTLQLRIDLDDDTGGQQDVRILAVSATYSMEE